MKLFWLSRVKIIGQLSAMEKFRPKRLDHRPAAWLREEPDYFITVSAETRGMNQFCHPVLGPLLLESVPYRNEKQIWFCHLVVLMPDHIHLMLNFPDLPAFAPVVGAWKHWLAHHHGIRWQENFFDHRIRGPGEFANKSDYIQQNPVRAGLVKKPEDWPYTWIAPVTGM